MKPVTLRLNPALQYGTVQPRLYGHFAEHLGRCCYDGLWDGHSFPGGVVQLLRELPVPLLRWPGGCYADRYHWKDGIGPRSSRPRRLGMSCGLQVVEDHSLGTHEFMQLCRLLQAEPYFAGNMGTGSPQEMCDWVEYCNSPLDTNLTNLRRKNGAPEPFGIRLWGVGNENWGCGGNYDAHSYALEYRRYATMLRHVEPALELVVCGFDEPWNKKVLETLGRHLDLINHFSIHHYWGGCGPATGFNEAQYYGLLRAAASTEEFVASTARLLEQATGEKGKIGVALDEWGVWHPEATTGSKYEQPGTLRDALAAAVALRGFHRQSAVLSLANLAQIVNVLQAPVQTTGATCWVTPTWHVFHLHAPHMGGVAVEAEVVDEDNLPDPAAATLATATQHQDSKLVVTVINSHLEAARQVTLATEFTRVQRARLLTAATPREQNTALQPENVKPVELEVAVRDGQLSWALPPHSLATLELAANGK